MLISFCYKIELCFVSGVHLRLVVQRQLCGLRGSLQPQHKPLQGYRIRQRQRHDNDMLILCQDGQSLFGESVGDDGDDFDLSKLQALLKKNSLEIDSILRGTSEKLLDKSARSLSFSELTSPRQEKTGVSQSKPSGGFNVFYTLPKESLENLGECCRSPGCSSSAELAACSGQSRHHQIQRTLRTNFVRPRI